MIQYLLDDQRILDARDNLDGPSTPIANRNINVKHSLESLRPGHFLVLIHWQLCALLALHTLRIAALAAFRRCHIDAGQAGKLA